MSRFKKREEALKTWASLQVYLKDSKMLETKELLRLEREGKKRKYFIDRIRQRLRRAIKVGK